MRNKILLSAIASLAVSTAAFAATSTGPGSSTITAGSDINGTVHAQALTAAKTLYASDSNMTSAANTALANYDKFITYTPNIAIGQGNLITIKVNNGAITATSGNKLWLADVNSSAEQNASGGAPVAAKMTDYVASGGNYTEMTFKFLSDVESGSELVLGNAFETNASLVADLGSDYGLVSRRTTLGLVVNAGLDCAENVTLEVINSKDQSADWFNVPNSNGESTTGVTVVKGVYIKLGVDGDNAAQGASAYDNADYETTECPTFSCTISISDDELAFGSSSSASASSCPTCSPTLSTSQDLLCQGSFLLAYNSSNLISGGGVTLSTIDVTTTSSSSVAALSTVKGELNDNATQDSLTQSSNTWSGALSTGLNATANNKVELNYTVDGTTVISPVTFDLGVKVNSTADVDTISEFMEFAEQGTPLKVAYLSGNPDYRSFVRVTSTSDATIQAVVTTEDGVSSSRFDTGYAITATSGGAVVVEAETLLNKAISDAAFTGTGKRFNATLYVKTTGTVDAVAYQTSGTSGSQRYLPVNGATGGTK